MENNGDNGKPEAAPIKEHINIRAIFKPDGTIVEANILSDLNPAACVQVMNFLENKLVNDLLLGGLATEQAYRQACAKLAEFEMGPAEPVAKE